jgi:hypothetical protein
MQELEPLFCKFPKFIFQCMYFVYVFAFDVDVVVVFIHLFCHAFGKCGHQKTRSPFVIRLSILNPANQSIWLSGRTHFNGVNDPLNLLVASHYSCSTQTTPPVSLIQNLRVAETKWFVNHIFKLIPNLRSLSLT